MVRFKRGICVIMIEIELRNKKMSIQRDDNSTQPHTHKTHSTNTSDNSIIIDARKKPNKKSSQSIIPNSTTNTKEYNHLKSNEQKNLHQETLDDDESPFLIQSESLNLTKSKDSNQELKLLTQYEQDYQSINQDSNNDLEYSHAQQEELQHEENKKDDSLEDTSKYFPSNDDFIDSINNNSLEKDSSKETKESLEQDITKSINRPKDSGMNSKIDEMLDKNDLDLISTIKASYHNKPLDYILYSKRIFIGVGLLACFTGLYMGYLFFGATSLNVLWNLKGEEKRIIKEIEDRRLENAKLQKKMLELKILEPQEF